MATELKREAFTTSRLMEFFSAKELIMQIGLPQPRWAIALLKEMIDNSLDACEGTGVPPEISITVQPDVLIGGCLTNERRDATHASLRCRPTNGS